MTLIRTACALFALLLLAPVASAFPGTTEVRAGAVNGTACVGDECVRTPVRAVPHNVGANATVHASLFSAGACPAKPCYPQVAPAAGYGYGGHAYIADKAIILGPGGGNPPSCGFGCPRDVVDWLVGQLP